MSLVNVGGIDVFSPNRNPTTTNFVQQAPSSPSRGEEGGHHWHPRRPKHHRHHGHGSKKHHCR